MQNRSFCFIGELEPVDDTSDELQVRLPAETGRHFSHVFETCFIPNAEKERKYPDDAEVSE